MLIHGVNKAPAELAAAVEGSGVIVVDNLNELQRLAQLLATAGAPAPDRPAQTRGGSR